MPVFSRFSRWLRSVFGGAISSMENPRLILEQNIRELNDQVPKMNENIATVKANVIMLEKESRRTQKEVKQLTSKIKAAIESERDDIAQQYAVRLEKARSGLERTREQLKNASAAYDQAMQVKKTFMRDKEQKIQEAKDALRAHERAQWQGRVADALEQFEVSGMDQTHDEMIRRIEEETARNEARVELALDSVDSTELQIEEDAERLRANELVKQFKMEMGYGGSEQVEGHGQKLELPEGEKEEADRSQEAGPEAARETKTVGRQRTQSDR